MKKISLVLSMMLMISGSLQAADNPEVLFSEARYNLQAAMELVKAAQGLLKGQPSKEHLRMAISYYADAGALFEKAAKTFQALGPEYVTEEDMVGARNAVQDCVQKINELKNALSQRTP